MQLTIANDVASKSFVSFKHSSISKLKTAIFLRYCHLIVYAITLLLRMRVGAVCGNHPAEGLRKERYEKTSSSIQWCQNFDLSKNWSSQAKLATGACKN